MPGKLVFLKTDQDFDQFRRSKLFTSATFRMRIRFNTNQNINRFGFIIPKKTVPQVTDRNKIKRRIKTLLLKHLANIKANDYLFFPQRQALKLKFPDLDQELVALMQKAGVWKYSKPSAK